MMTNANAATTIAAPAALRAESPDTTGAAKAAIAALTIGIIVSLIVIAVMLTAPAAIPTWCATHGCP